jgi:hypothetical protein
MRPVGACGGLASLGAPCSFVAEGAKPGSAERPMGEGSFVFPVVVSPFSEAGPTDFAPAPRPVVVPSSAIAAAAARASTAADNVNASFIFFFSVRRLISCRLAARRLFGADALGPASTDVEGKSSLARPFNRLQTSRLNFCNSMRRRNARTVRHQDPNGSIVSIHAYTFRAALCAVDREPWSAFRVRFRSCRSDEHICRTTVIAAPTIPPRLWLARSD